MPLLTWEVQTPFLGKRQHALIISYNLGHSNIIHCFSSPACLLWRHPLAKHPTSLFTSAELVHKLYLKSRRKLSVHCLLHTCFQYSLLSFRASTVYTCSTFSVLSKTMVFLSATVVQGRCFYMRFTQMQCRKCCNNCFDVYKLLMSNDIDRPPASWSIYCGDEKQ